MSDGGTAANQATTTLFSISTTTVATSATAAPPGGDAATTGSSSDGVSGGILIAAVVIAAVASAAIGFLIGRHRYRTDRAAGTPRPADPEPPRPGPAEAVPAQTTPADGIAQDRAELISALVDVRDRVGPGGLSDLIGLRLAKAGVDTIDPVGEPFTTDRHWAQGTDQLSTDPARQDTIASTVTYGYLDRGHPYRMPGVIVYRLERET
jgi:hypothetical protein